MLIGPPYKILDSLVSTTALLFFLTILQERTNGLFASLLSMVRH